MGNNAGGPGRSRRGSVTGLSRLASAGPGLASNLKGGLGPGASGGGRARKRSLVRDPGQMQQLLQGQSTRVRYARLVVHT
eukprot:3939827-Rhodomonas_salina.2